MISRRRLIFLCSAGLMVLLVVALGLYRPRHYSEPAKAVGLPQQAPFVLEQSILTRAIAIEAPEKLAALFDSMPSGVISRDSNSKKMRAALWSLFFSGSMTKLAHLASPRPFIVFYNPIADIAFVEGCNFDTVTRAARCMQACALPGEILAGEPVSGNPTWLRSTEPIEALQMTAGDRMRALGAAHPASSPESADWQRTFCSVENQSASEKRLLSLAMSSGKFDEARFREAAGYYVAHAMAAAAQHGPSKADSVVTVLEHLNEMTMSGAVAGGQAGWIIFLTQKRSGWRMAVFTASASSDGALRLEAVRLLSISTNKHDGERP